MFSEPQALCKAATVSRLSFRGWCSGAASLEILHALRPHSVPTGRKIVPCNLGNLDSQVSHEFAPWFSLFEITH